MLDSVRAEVTAGELGVLDLFRIHRSADPERVAVIDDAGAQWNRRELDEASNEVAVILGGLGIRPGEAVLVCLPNRLEWMAAYLGVLKAGGVPGTVPVTSDPLAIADDMRCLGAHTVLLPRTHRGRDFADEVVAIHAHLGRQAHALLFGSLPGQIEVISTDGPSREQPALPVGTAHVLFSSSTTGAPKAIAHTEASLSAYNLGIIDRYGVRECDTIFMPSPLGHSTGVWHGARMSLLTGSTLVVQDAWNAGLALSLVEDHGAAITVAATPFLADLIAHPWEGRVKLAPLRTFLCGGAQVPPELLQRAAIELPMTHVGSVWAMSEAGATCSLPDDSAEKVTGTCGLPLPGVTIATISETAATNPAGVVGELVIRTPSQCLTYVGQDEMFASCFTADGMFRTGDLAVIDAAGYMTITGRVKDLIIRGGVNIGPVPIENAMQAVPDVKLVAVVGRPDPRLGERICAVVVTHSGTELQLEDALGVLDRLDVPRRMWPESVVTVDRLPMTPAGKVRKRELVDTLWPVTT